jgi:ABC-type nickel/cobalt efflux system permease component RcnA
MAVTDGVSMALALGFLLGLKHATDADHVVAVSTIAREFRSPLRGLWVGVSWGLGHTTPLLIVGVVILVLKGAVLERYAQAAPALEFGVGVMLVALGLEVFWNLRKGRLHVHHHSHAGSEHVHIHASHQSAAEPAEQLRANVVRIRDELRPRFRRKSYLVGVMHGLAGSAAVTLVLLPEIDSAWVGLGYLFLFGIGTMVSMAMITLVLGAPFVLTKRFRAMDGAISTIAGGASVLFGCALMADLALGLSLLPF